MNRLGLIAMTLITGGTCLAAGKTGVKVPPSRSDVRENSSKAHSLSDKSASTKTTSSNPEANVRSSNPSTSGQSNSIVDEKCSVKPSTLDSNEKCSLNPQGKK